MAKDPCIFCKIIKKTAPSNIVFEDKYVVAFEDINPQAPVHVIIIPRVHIEKISSLEEKSSGIAGRMILAANAIARERKIEESGYRIVINCNKDAGQAVFHIHLHLLGGRKMAWPPG